jgi:glycosyltransferase involved in cell wall biosynthesis
MPQILGEGRGLVVPPRDVEALAAALARAADPAAAPLRARAAEFGQRYSLEDLREALLDLMTEWWVGPHPRPLSQPHSRTPGRGE